MIRLCFESFFRKFGELAALAAFSIALLCLWPLWDTFYSLCLLPFLDNASRLVAKVFGGGSVTFEVVAGSVFCFLVAYLTRERIWNSCNDAPRWAKGGATSFRWSFSLTGVVCLISLPLICGFADFLHSAVQGIEAAGLINQAADLKARCVSMASLDDFMKIFASIGEIHGTLPH